MYCLSGMPILQGSPTDSNRQIGRRGRHTYDLIGTGIGDWMSARTWGLLLLLAMLWGSSFFFYKILVAALPPVTVVWAAWDWRPSRCICGCWRRANPCR